MNLIKTVKKVMALGTGAAMMGATLSTGAFAAADLSTYPDPFIQNGKFNGLIVVGDTAKPVDILGAVDIATSLQFASRVPRVFEAPDSSIQSSFSVTGEAWRVQTSSKDLELSETGSGMKEKISDISTSLSKDELPQLLADGVVIGESDYEYSQTINFDTGNDASGDAYISNPKSRTVSLLENDADDEVLAPTFFIADGDQIARYSLEFSNDLESSITDSNGDVDDAGKFLWDLQHQDISLLGNKWTILTATTDEASDSKEVELTLMSGSVLDTLESGSTKTYEISGNSYEVTVGRITSSNDKYSVTFTVNGVVTKRSLRRGSTVTLADGSLLGVKEFQVENFLGGARIVQFFLGANKVVLADDDIEEHTLETSNELRVGDESIDGANVIIKGERDGDTMSIESIELDLRADGDIYLQKGEKLSEKLGENSDMLMDAWDILFSGLEEATTEDIRIVPKGEERYNLEFVDGDDNDVSLPLVYADDSSGLFYGAEDDNRLVFNEGTEITEGDYFILSNGDEKESFAFQYVKASKPDDGEGELFFDNVGKNDDIEVDYDLGSDGKNIGKIKVGGIDYSIDAVETAPDKKDFGIKINLDGESTTGLVNIYTPAGATIAFDSVKSHSDYRLVIPDSASEGLLLSVSTNDDDDYNNKAPSVLNFTITSASTHGEVRINPIGDAKLYTEDSDADKEYAYTTLGTYVEIKGESSEPRTVDIEYPKRQRLPAVFVTGSGTSVKDSTTAGEGDVSYYETMEIGVGSAALASEVPNPTSKNVISVGGPCVNAVSAQLLSSGADCAAGFEPGKAMIKLFEHANGRVGMVVAGYSGADTRKASRVVATYEQWQTSGVFKGDTVEVTQSTFNNIAVSRP